jgi:hypothetical protein
MSNWYQSAEARAVHRDLRRMKGRTGVVHDQYDATTKSMRRTISRDPIYDLYVARANRYLSPTRYGEIRQRVVSPVTLPDLRHQS